MTDEPRSFSQRERAALADALMAAGPDAPTLCEGWATRDLAAHLVVRESRPDAMAGAALPFLAGHLRSTMDAALADGYAHVVRRFRDGPPRLSPFALPGLDERANTVEHFVHHEDVRRAQDGWAPRELSVQDSETLWRATTAMAKLAARGKPGGLVLVTTAGPRAKVKNGEPVQVMTGPPGELLMWLLGRTDHAAVALS
jgi:uncharacterized protein (TIGR03085 family)